MSNEVQLKNFLNKNNIKVQSVKYSNLLGSDCYLIYACKNYNVNYLRKHLGNIEIFRVPKLQGQNGCVYVIEAKDGHKLLEDFNFLDALGESNYAELIRNQLIISGTGSKKTRVRFARGKLVLLYNTKYSSTCIAKSLNICNDAVVDVSANGCGELKMIVLLDRVNDPWVTEPIPEIKFCEDFDFNRDILCASNTDLRFKNRMLENGMSCKNWDINWHDLIMFESDGSKEDIAEIFKIPKKSIIDMRNEKGTKVILLDRIKC